MKKLLLVALAAVLAISLGAGIGLAGDNIPSAKCAYYTADVQKADASDFVDLISAQIKTGEPKDLIMDVCAESTLVTTVKLSGKQETDNSAEARIVFRVLVDDVVAMPDEVTFASRLVSLTGNLAHEWEGDPTGILLDDHWILFHEETSTANCFNFASMNVGSGVHTVVVQAKVEGNAVGNDANDWGAVIGNVAVVVDEVNLKDISGSTLYPPSP